MPARNNTSGHRGVSWNANAGRWQVQYQRTHVGLYETLAEAAAAARAARGEWHLHPSFPTAPRSESDPASPPRSSS